MEFIGATASIAGILAVAAKTGSWLHTTISSAADAPLVLSAMDVEVNEVHAAVSSLQILLADLATAPPHRAALIQVDHLIATLTECVLTFSELDVALAPFAGLREAKVPLRARLRWTRAEAECGRIVERLQRHKASVSLMLNIMQCASDAEASRLQVSLETMLGQLLQSNQQLCARLRNLEDAFDARSVVTRAFDNTSVALQSDDATISPTTHPAGSLLMPPIDAFGIRFTFEADLESSRVYRMARKNNCAHSLVSSAVRTQTWSIFSGLSLADISTISVIALPHYPSEVLVHAQQHSYLGDSHAVMSRNSTSNGTIMNGRPSSKLFYSSRNNVADRVWKKTPLLVFERVTQERWIE